LFRNRSLQQHQTFSTHFSTICMILGLGVFKQHFIYMILGLGVFKQHFICMILGLGVFKHFICHINKMLFKHS
jgi:deoxyhypusine synthase